MMAKKTAQTYYDNALTGARVVPEDWQMKIKKGDCYEIASEPYPTIYGEILDAMDEKGRFPVQTYSALCPDGQQGILWVVEPTRILSREEFEYARAQSWKVETVEA